MSKDHHDEPFDEGTLIKLEIYKNYLTSWLPVFLMVKSIKNNHVNIFDFFSGPGKDKSGLDGSPIIALTAAIDFTQIAKDNGKTINLYFFDQKLEKINRLNQVISNTNYDRDTIHITTEVIEFDQALEKYEDIIRRDPNLLFMDQTGIKAITENTLKKLLSFKYTDLLFYLASSYAKRFSNTKEFRKYLNIEPGEFRDISQNNIHRFMCQYYQSIADNLIEYYFCPFSIKKNANVYGLIFGSRNHTGLQKFLDVAWKIDPHRGEANFDIDNEQISEQPSLFPHLPQKLTMFEQELEAQILKGTIKSDGEAFKHTLQAGFIGKHAKKVIKSLIRNKRIYMDKQPRCSKEALAMPRGIKLL